MVYKYFKLGDAEDINSLKKQYYRLAREHHPDFGGSNAAMKQVIAEYEQALLNLGNLTKKNYKLDQDFVDIIDELLRMHMAGTDIEICGWFIYVHGNTRPYKDKLKEQGLYWNGKKQCWYWKPAWYRRRGGVTWSMDKIRDVYGSQQVEQEPLTAVTAG